MVRRLACVPDAGHRRPGPMGRIDRGLRRVLGSARELGRRRSVRGSRALATLKRSELRRKTPLGPQKDALRRSKPLARAKGRLARSKAQKPRLSQETRAKAFARTTGLCGCGCGRPADDAHHIFPKQKWPELADVLENILPAARFCHEGHESAMHRFSRGAVAGAEPLATTSSMRAYLQRTYPQGSLAIINEER